MTHLLKWDVRIERRWHPYYTLGRMERIDPEPVPPIAVQIAVDFDDNEAALDFERKVRELLEAA